MKASRFLTLGAVAALLPIAGALAQSPTKPTDPAQSPPSSQQGASFESLDTNADGKISKAEASVNPNVSAQFSRYDQNGDGYIELSEVNAANNPPAEEPSTPPKQ